LNIIPRNAIIKKRYHESKKENGIYENCFNKAFEFFQKNSFENIQMVYYDKKNLNLIFVNINPEVYKNKLINLCF
jgi:hypothetical protein